jgi:hypothetical protein
MTEVLFVLTTIFVAYVIRVVLDEKKSNSRVTATNKQTVKPGLPDEKTNHTLTTQTVKPAALDTTKTKTSVSVASASEKPVPNVASITPTVTPKLTAVSKKDSKKAVNPKKPDTKTASVKKQASKATKPQTDSNPPGLKDPKTGEVTKSYSNFYFAKRWIKEALVEEGLLEKIYKNNEIDENVEQLIKAGIAKLEQMEKYKP